MFFFTLIFRNRKLTIKEKVSLILPFLEDRKITAMSRTCAFSILAWMLSSLLGIAEDWTTSDGTIYKGVTVVKVEDDSVTILDSDGGARIPLEKLPANLQQKFHYDPAKAKEASEERTQQNESEQSETQKSESSADDSTPRDSSGEVLTPDKVALNGFLGIAWSSSPDLAKDAMVQKGFTFLGLGKQGELIFSGGSFADIPVQAVTLTFYKDQFFKAEVDFPKNEDDAKNISTLTDAYVRKYGVQYEPNYPDPSTAIWQCKDGNNIMLIDSNGIGVFYLNGRLSDLSHDAEVNKVRSTDL